MQRIAIGLSVYRGAICAEQVYLWLDLGEAINRAKDEFMIGSFQYQDKCGLEGMRNALVYAAMQSNSDWLFMIDPKFYVIPTEDYPSPGVSILKMIDDAAKKDAALITAMCHRDKEKIIETDIAELNIAAINLNFLRKNWPQPPWFTTKMGKMDSTYLTCSDVLFCQGIKERAGHIFIDGRVMFGYKLNGERR